MTRSTGTDTTLAPTQNVPGIGADAWRIIVARGLRSLAYGMLAVVLAVTLSAAGFSAPAIGALVSVSLAGDLCGTYLIGLYADRWGRRRTLVVLALPLAATGVVFALVRVYPLLLIAAFCGTLGTSGSETAPFLPIEQAILPRLAPAAHRTDLFARYNLVASVALALGALAAGLPSLLLRAGILLATGTRLLFALYVAAGPAVAALTARLSPQVEMRPAAAAGTAPRALFPPLGRS